MPELTVRFTVNGRAVEITTPPFRRLLDLLREDLGLTGSKEGCGEGECGACSVILNGELVNSCLVPAIQVQGGQVTTIEAVETTPLGAAVARAFLRHGGAQCGICTPGMVMIAWWIAQNRDRLPAGVRVAPAASPAARGSGGPAQAPASGGGLRDLMAGNLCRCTGYASIIESVEAALAETAAAGGSLP
jgi:carbon-monoxide dehydrogenase small subunit